MTGPVTKVTAAMNSGAPSRRQFFGSAAGAGVAAAQPPIFITAGASSLALACEWCADHRVWVSQQPVDWGEEAFQAETDKMDAVFHRAITEPSQSTADIAAKARMLLEDLTHGGLAEEEFDDARLTIVVLREIVALAA